MIAPGLACDCGAPLPLRVGTADHVEGDTLVCDACAKVWTLNLYRDDCDVVLVQHEPADA